jgi:ferredoxin-NADP reductase
MLQPNENPSRGMLTALLDSHWLRPLNDPDALEGLVRYVDRTWSLSRIKALVVETRRETADTRTLVLEANKLWPGHTAGQHVSVGVDIDGRHVRRTFSISSRPRADRTLEITVNRRPEGTVSVWWNDDAHVGDVITLSAPEGDFVLPPEPSSQPASFVMISAGSGITPLMAMLEDLFARAPQTRVHFVHSARSESDLIFADRLRRLDELWPGLTLSIHFSGSQGRLGLEALTELAEGAGDTPTFFCGPQEFLRMAEQAWSDSANSASLAFESFGLTLPERPSESGAPRTVTALQSGRTFEAEVGVPLLVAAERAGLAPAHGCRMGICHTCKRRLRSGVVEDLRSGRVHDGNDELIAICVSAARTDVELDL